MDTPKLYNRGELINSMDINKKMVRYNELTEAWQKGCAWSDIPGRSNVQLEKGEARLNEILTELSQIYTELNQLGIKVKAEQKLNIKTGK